MPGSGKLKEGVEEAGLKTPRGDFERLEKYALVTVPGEEGKEKSKLTWGGKKHRSPKVHNREAQPRS